MIDIYKKKLRQKLLNQRKTRSCSVEVIERVFLLSKNLLKQYSTIAFYHPIQNEINLQQLWHHAWEKECTVLLPKVISPTKIIFCPFHSSEDLALGKFNILEPTTNEYQQKIDTMFIPGLAFDKKGNRLGYGAGYYDRFLLHQDIQKIGVCYQEEFLDSIPVEAHDITMDFVLTNENLFQINTSLQ